MGSKADWSQPNCWENRLTFMFSDIYTRADCSTSRTQKSWDLGQRAAMVRLRGCKDKTMPCKGERHSMT